MPTGMGSTTPDLGTPVNASFPDDWANPQSLSVMMYFRDAGGREWVKTDTGFLKRKDASASPAAYLVFVGYQTARLKYWHSLRWIKGLPKRRAARKRDRATQ